MSVATHDIYLNCAAPRRKLKRSGSSNAALARRRSTIAHNQRVVTVQFPLLYRRSDACWSTLTLSQPLMRRQGDCYWNSTRSTLKGSFTVTNTPRWNYIVYCILYWEQFLVIQCHLKFEKHFFPEPKWWQKYTPSRQKKSSRQNQSQKQWKSEDYGDCKTHLLYTLKTSIISHVWYHVFYWEHLQLDIWKDDTIS